MFLFKYDMILYPSFADILCFYLMHDIRLKLILVLQNFQSL